MEQGVVIAVDEAARCPSPVIGTRCTIVERDATGVWVEIHGSFIDTEGEERWPEDGWGYSIRFKHSEVAVYVG